MRTLLRVAITATFLNLGFALGAFALSEPAYPQGSDHAKAEPNLTLPMAKPVRCATPFSAVAVLPGWHVLEGKRLQAYLTTMFTTPLAGDALAYAVNGDKVALVLAMDGCVIGWRTVPEKMHRNTVLKALGMVV